MGKKIFMVSPEDYYDFPVLKLYAEKKTGLFKENGQRLNLNPAITFLRIERAVAPGVHTAPKPSGRDFT
jgi:hypothetical protein